MGTSVLGYQTEKAPDSAPHSDYNLIFFLFTHGRNKLEFRVFLATFVHKGRVVTIAAASHFIGNVIFVAIHFASPLYEAGSATPEICDLDSKSTLSVTLYYSLSDILLLSK